MWNSSRPTGRVWHKQPRPEPNPELASCSRVARMQRQRRERLAALSATHHSNGVGAAYSLVPSLTAATWCCMMAHTIDREQTGQGGDSPGLGDGARSRWSYRHHPGRGDLASTHLAASQCALPSLPRSAVPGHRRGSASYLSRSSIVQRVHPTHQMLPTNRSIPLRGIRLLVVRSYDQLPGFRRKFSLLFCFPVCLFLCK